MEHTQQELPPQFKSWFAGSKVVDAEGNPLIVYHGSNAKFDTFSYKFLGPNGRGRSEGSGFYFTNDKSIANAYGNELYTCYVKIKKPLSLTTRRFSNTAVRKIIMNIIKLEKEIDGTDVQNGILSNYGDVSHEGFYNVFNEAVKNMSEFVDTAVDFQGNLIGSGIPPDMVNKAIFLATGYDGVISDGHGKRPDQTIKYYIPFFANQIKSIKNSGSYNPNSDNIEEEYKMNIYDIIKEEYKKLALEWKQSSDQEYKSHIEDFFKDSDFTDEIMKSEMIVNQLIPGAKIITKITDNGNLLIRYAENSQLFLILGMTSKDGKIQRTDISELTQFGNELIKKIEGGVVLVTTPNDVSELLIDKMVKVANSRGINLVKQSSAGMDVEINNPQLDQKFKHYKMVQVSLGND